jgi:inorganic pyrophosphatase
VLAVPTEKVLPLYARWKTYEDLNPVRLRTIEHFFEHYKDLDPGKWVKVLGWGSLEEARQEILSGAEAYRRQHAGA